MVKRYQVRTTSDNSSETKNIARLRREKNMEIKGMIL